MIMKGKSLKSLKFKGNLALSGTKLSQLNISLKGNSILILQKGSSEQRHNQIFSQARKI